MKKLIPRKGYFTVVKTSSIWPNDVGYVTEVTAKTVEVKYTNDRIGKFNIDNNEFAEIGVSFTETFFDKTSLDEKLTAIQDALNKALSSDMKSNPPATGRVKSTLEEFRQK